MDGVLIIDKSQGITSHDVVLAIRKKLGVSKVGHLGTLDPMATGVLPVCVGKATRVAQFIPSAPKEYEGEIRFGFATNTYDREGVPTGEETPFRSSREEILAAMSSLTGVLDQVPPPFSAKKIGGEPSHKLARKNAAVAMAPSRIEVQKFESIDLSGRLMTFRVVCSPGTYIRSLAHDLGLRLGCGAHLNALRRTRSGDFRLESAVKLDQSSSLDLIPMERLLHAMPCIDVSDGDENKVAHGNPFRSEPEAKLARMLSK